MRKKICILAFALFLIPTFAFAEGGERKGHKGIHHGGPYKKMIKEHCKASPGDEICNKMKEKREKMKKRKKYCEANPTEEKCAKMKERMDKRKAHMEEMKAKCKDNPEKCKARMHKMKKHHEDAVERGATQMIDQAGDF